MARIVTITSGKGGVGKTSISLNLSLALASQGFKVCLFDADLGLANVNILTGIYPKRDLAGVISGQFTLNDIIIRNYQGIDIIPGSSGIDKLANLTRTQTGTLISAFLDLESYDYFIFDTSAGISSQVISFCMASHEIVLVVTTEPTSLTDAYAMLKVLAKHGYERPVRVIVNQVTSADTAKKAYSKLKNTARKFLSLKVAPLGVMASDKNVRAAVVSQTPFYKLFPDTVAAKCIENICNKLVFKTGPASDMQLELFWDRCLAFLEKYNQPEPSATEAAQSPAVSDHEAEKEGIPRAGENKDDGEVKERLAVIETRLSSIMDALDEIKSMIKPEKSQPEPEAEPETSPPEPREISLDFESWFKKKVK